MGTMAVELTQHKEWCAGLGKGDGVNMCCPSSSLSRLLLPLPPYPSYPHAICLWKVLSHGPQVLFAREQFVLLFLSLSLLPLSL